MWVLIVVSGVYVGQTVSMQEFSSMFKCQTAAQLVKDNSKPANTVTAFCVEK